MKLHFDFTTNQSLGNVNDNCSKDNFQSFENAKTLFKSDKQLIGKCITDFIKESNDYITIGSRITIPVGYLSNAGFIDNLEFEVIAVNGDEVNLALINVNNKTSKT